MRESRYFFGFFLLRIGQFFSSSKSCFWTLLLKKMFTTTHNLHLCCEMTKFVNFFFSPLQQKFTKSPNCIFRNFPSIFPQLPPLSCRSAFLEAKWSRKPSLFFAICCRRLRFLPTHKPPFCSHELQTGGRRWSAQRGSGARGVADNAEVVEQPPATPQRARRQPLPRPDPRDQATPHLIAPGDRTAGPQEERGPLILFFACLISEKSILASFLLSFFFP